MNKPMTMRCNVCERLTDQQIAEAERDARAGRIMDNEVVLALVAEVKAERSVPASDARARAIKEAIRVAEAEPELPGAMLPELRARLLADPEGVLRASVRSTKACIVAALRALGSGSESPRDQGAGARRWIPDACRHGREPECCHECWPVETGSKEER